MTNHPSNIPENRELDAREMRLLRWLLENGIPEAKEHLSGLDTVKVVSKCACGCPSINFTDEWGGGMTTLADYQFDDPNGGLAGVFAFEYKGKLAGIDVWSIDGIANPKVVPDPEILRPLDRV